MIFDSVPKHIKNVTEIETLHLYHALQIHFSNTLLQIQFFLCMSEIDKETSPVFLHSFWLHANIKVMRRTEKKKIEDEFD